MNEHELLSEALKRTDPAERTAFLDQACAGNSELRRRLEERLAGYADAGGTLDQPPVAPAEFTATADLPTPIATGEHRPDWATEALARPDPDATTARESASPVPRAAGVSTGEGIGTVIAGRYTLVDVIGEGGMGSVYLASQTEPVKRQVALKLIKTGMDSRGVLARFDAERQALALMDHPNIARIYDGGLTPAGQPFFVMELVQGVPLTEYCDAHQVPRDEQQTRRAGGVSPLSVIVGSLRAGGVSPLSVIVGSG
jgi:eukaryotic-like serine/threonine-protein kinase